LKYITDLPFFRNALSSMRVSNFLVEIARNSNFTNMRNTAHQLRVRYMVEENNDNGYPEKMVRSYRTRCFNHTRLKEENTSKLEAPNSNPTENNCAAKKDLVT
jgi:hypothetical protein